MSETGHGPLEPTGRDTLANQDGGSQRSYAGFTVSELIGHVRDCRESVRQQGAIMRGILDELRLEYGHPSYPFAASLERLAFGTYGPPLYSDSMAPDEADVIGEIQRLLDSGASERGEPPGAPANRETALIESATVRLEVVGVRVEMPSNNPIVLLREARGTRYLPCWVGAVEATAIANVQQGVVSLKPLTHQLFANTLRAASVIVEQATITELRDEVFHCFMSIRNGVHRHVVEARVSDAVSMALHCGDVPIMTTEALMNEAGVEVPDGEGDPTEPADQNASIGSDGTT